MATLKIVQGGEVGKVYPLEGERWVMGRSPECDLVLDVAAVSRRHVILSKENGQFFVQDLGSRNGTYINKLGTRITRRMVTLFAVCAVLPVAAAIFVAYEQVHEALVAQRHAQLREIAAGYGSALIDRLWQNPRFMSAALPHKVFPPLINCYREGGSFGFHIDNALRQPKGSPERVRTDLSSTLFLSDPDSYDGGHY